MAIAFSHIAAVLLTLTVLLVSRYWPGTKAATVSPAKPTSDDKAGTTIEPIVHTDWDKIEPLKLRPFKPIYHINMALRSSAAADLVLIDSNYLSRISLRRDIMRKHGEKVMGCTPTGLPAVREVYSYLLSDYLPARYPSLFTKDEKMFSNKITNTTLPLDPPDDPTAALRGLGETIEDDLFLLESTAEGHRCTAYLCCFPAGFDPAAKLGKLLSEIHEPVPSYGKIAISMERFFGRLAVGKSVNRVNWTLQTTADVFTPATSPVHADDLVEDDSDVDVCKATARMELQTLTRLPKTGSILFSFKTYTYPLVDIKAEGLGPELADAIEGLKSGNAPGMWEYKGAPRWGERFCEYLRS